MDSLGRWRCTHRNLLLHHKLGMDVAGELRRDCRNLADDPATGLVEENL